MHIVSRLAGLFCLLPMAPGQIAMEAFTGLPIFENLFSFSLTFHAYDWLLSNGIKTVFLAVVSVQMDIF